ncbi:MAG: phosphate ABC transporter substrate-binding protein PstS [Nitrososphaerota archaeon]|uniref:phosphate ABC transporter substrate-binding protein PstS n=1 Tax=Pyrobaculum sp. TaxID=2004705 RepID=UPI003163DB96
MKPKLLIPAVAAVVVIAIALALLASPPGTGGPGTTQTTPSPSEATPPGSGTTGGQNTQPATAVGQGVQQTPSPTQATPSTTQATTKQPRLSGAITGGGSTFVNPQMITWSKRFYELTGAQVNYQSIGSGAGAAQFLAKKLDFGASDVPMPKDKYQEVKGRFVQFPVVIGSIVLVYNIPEAAYEKTGKYLNLTSEVISLIYMGEIKQWCDERIQKLNPGLKLPCKDIVAVHRSDGSGTTAAFTLYLAVAYPPWNQTVGWGYTVKWPADEKAKGTGAKGNEGVAQTVLQTPYSIGYVEYAYWSKNRDKYDKIGGVAYLKNDNDGKYYFPTAEAVSAGTDAGLKRYVAKYGAPPSPDADWNPVSIEFTNPPTGYPILAFVYVFLWKDYAAEGYGDAAMRVAIIKEFFKWVLTDGQRNLVEGYIPLPESVARIGLQALEQIK